jgi:hypothetical protein
VKKSETFRLVIIVFQVLKSAWMLFDGTSTRFCTVRSFRGGTSRESGCETVPTGLHLTVLFFSRSSPPPFLPHDVAAARRGHLLLRPPPDPAAFIRRRRTAPSSCTNPHQRHATPPPIASLWLTLASRLRLADGALTSATRLCRLAMDASTITTNTPPRHAPMFDRAAGVAPCIGSG